MRFILAIVNAVASACFGLSFYFFTCLSLFFRRLLVFILLLLLLLPFSCHFFFTQYQIGIRNAG